jgi:hypothetical protein
MVAICVTLASCRQSSPTCEGNCSSDGTVAPPAIDGGASPDLAVAPDADAAAPPDAAAFVVDLGTDDALASPDSGVTAAGPWPESALVVYPTPGPLIDGGPDDAQNIWAVGPDALYLLQPGHTAFRRYTAADGLHITPFVDPSGNSTISFITAVAGGGADEVFVGYYGYESTDPFADIEAQKELGNADKILLRADGTLDITRYFFRCDYQRSTCWEDRSVRRMLYAHDGPAAGHLFLGFNHGVSHVFADSWGDHIHVEVWYHNSDGTVTEKIGEWFALALTSDGDLWTGGRYAAGLQPWNPTPHAWVDGRYTFAFTVDSSDHLLNQPTGYREDERGAAVTPDGTVWLASFGGLASWNPNAANGNYNQIRRWPGVGGELADIAADPDGTLWIVGLDERFVRFDPATGTVTPWPGISGARRVIVDRSVTPRAVYVSMDSGLAVIRAK